MTIIDKGKDSDRSVSNCPPKRDFNDCHDFLRHNCKT